MAITILDAAKAEGVQTQPDGSITLGEFDRVGLPFFSGCQCCGASLAPYNAYPSTTGYIRCSACIDEAGFETAAEFNQWCKEEVGADF